MGEKNIKLGQILNAAKQMQPTPLHYVIAGEAANQGEKGMRAVASIIYNRRKQNRKYFGGNDYNKIVTYPGQFSAWSMPEKWKKQRYSEVKPIVDKIASELLSDKFKPIFPEYVTYYMTESAYRRLLKNPNSWVHNLELYAKIGDHLFFYDKREVRR